MNPLLENYKRILLDGTINTRDMGGIVTEDGHHLRKGLAFRSDTLNRLSPRDVAFWESQNLRLILDVRSPSEQERFPDVEIPCADHEILTIQHEVDLDHILQEPIHPKTYPDVKDPYWKNFLPFLYRYDPHGDMHQGFPRMYSMMPLDPVTQAHIHDALSLLLNKDREGAFVVHCKDGKDRTGFFCYLFLSALGVSYEEVLRDYLISRENEETRARAMAKEAKEAGIDDPVLLESIYWINTVDETNLAALKASLERHYGSVQSYLRQIIGLSEEDLAQLRDRYLE